MRLGAMFRSAVLVLAVLSPTHSALAQPKPAAKTHTVLITGFRFVPERLEVEVGDTVIWKNQDIVPHTATAKKVFDSKKLDTGQSWSYVATKKGTHPYICLYHPTMAGELVVNEVRAK